MSKLYYSDIKIYDNKLMGFTEWYLELKKEDGGEIKRPQKEIDSMYERYRKLNSTREAYFVREKRGLGFSDVDISEMLNKQKE